MKTWSATKKFKEKYSGASNSSRPATTNRFCEQCFEDEFDYIKDLRRSCLLTNREFGVVMIVLTEVVTHIFDPDRNIEGLDKSTGRSP